MIAEAGKLLLPRGVAWLAGPQLAQKEEGIEDPQSSRSY